MSLGLITFFAIVNGRRKRLSVAAQADLRQYDFWEDQLLEILKRMVEETIKDSPVFSLEGTGESLQDWLNYKNIPRAKQVEPAPRLGTGPRLREAGGRGPLL